MNRLALVLTIISLPAISHALTVTNTNDSGPGSLRQAIANTPSGGTIDFAVTGTIMLMSEIIIDKSINIQGPGADLLTISGGNTNRIFVFFAISGSQVSISNLRFTNGSANGGNGGAIVYSIDPDFVSFALVEVNKCVFENNTADEGGAVWIGNTTVVQDNKTRFKWVINDSTFSSNKSRTGGAIFTGLINVDLEINRTTFASNTAVGSEDDIDAIGGAITLGDEISTLTVKNSTFESNKAMCSADKCLVLGGAIATVAQEPGTEDNSEIKFNTFNNNDISCTGQDCILSGSSINMFLGDEFLNPIIKSNIFYSDSIELNCATCIGLNPGIECNTADVVTSGYNISDDITCADGGPGEQPSTNAQLDPAGLRDNGGMTRTIALLTESPAIDMGGPNCPPPDTDQRMVTRPQGPACDVGAYELAFRNVPTLSEWGLITMAGILGLAGFYAIRKRRVIIKIRN